jgi:predicted RNase H-like nuclease
MLSSDASPKRVKPYPCIQNSTLRKTNMSELDKDFEQIAQQINAKIKEAAAALREANELADKAKLPGLIFTQWIGENMEMDNRRSGNTRSKRDIQDEVNALEQKYELIDVHELEAALGDGGWSTSSSYC